MSTVIKKLERVINATITNKTVTTAKEGTGEKETKEVKRPVMKITNNQYME